MRTEQEITNEINKLTEDFKRTGGNRKEFLQKQIKLMEEALKCKDIKKNKKHEIKIGLNFIKMTEKML